MVGFDRSMPMARPLLLLVVLWACAAWLTTGAWGVAAQDLGVADGLTAYYAVRAPLVGATTALLWAPVLVNLPLVRPPRDGVRLAVEPRTRFVLRALQGAVMGQLMAATATFLLLFVWPNDMQNTRMDALKWGAVFWRLYWYLLPPAGALAGGLSVWIMVVWGRRR